MSRTGQKVGLRRDARNETVPAVPAVGFDPFEVRTVLWRPRAGDDDRRAILASERSAVFDRTDPEVLKAREAADVPAVDAAVESRLGPMPSTWTPELVHCRLRAVHCMCMWLPRINWPAGFRSILQQLQASGGAGTGRGRVLTAVEMDRIDWTLARVCGWPEDDQLIIRGFMSLLSLREIAGELERLKLRGIGGRKGISKDSVHRRYRALLTTMAREWIEADEPIDRDTTRVWSSGGDDL